MLLSFISFSNSIEITLLKSEMKINMKLHKQLTKAFLAVFCFVLSVSAQVPKPDVVYVPTSQPIVDAMLKLAKVTKDDTVYDLGCGDGRIVITAAKEFGASGVGIEIDAELVRRAKENARRAGVADKVQFLKADLFKTDFSRATVVMLYLSPGVNLQLRPQLLKQLKPGTRIVSHDFDMGEWKPEQTIKIEEATLYFWTVPTKKSSFKKANKF
jgi:SAM-dependent methyltransferase